MTDSAQVIDNQGTRATLLDPVDRKIPSPWVRAGLDDGRTVRLHRAQLLAQRDGTYRLNMPFDSLQPSESVERPAIKTEASPVAVLEQAEERVRPIPLDDPPVTSRITGQVQLEKAVTETTQTVREPLQQSEVDVERVAVGREIEAMPEIRYEGDTMIIPVVEEVMVKRLMLREEVRVTRRNSTLDHQQDVVLRSERLDVRRRNAGDEEWVTQ